MRVGRSPREGCTAPGDLLQHGAEAPGGAIPDAVASGDGIVEIAIVARCGGKPDKASDRREVSVDMPALILLALWGQVAVDHPGHPAPLAIQLGDLFGSFEEARLLGTPPKPHHCLERTLTQMTHRRALTRKFFPLAEVVSRPQVAVVQVILIPVGDALGRLQRLFIAGQVVVFHQSCEDRRLPPDEACAHRVAAYQRAGILARELLLGPQCICEIGRASCRERV